MRKSAHYELRLPERDDQYNIDDFDDNFTAIDIAMNDNANAAANNKSAIADEKASREKSDGEIRSDLTAHKGDKNNPHSVTKAQVGLGSAENKSSETIRGELTKKNVTDALGYTPAKESDVPSVQSDLTAHKNDKNNPHSVTKAQVGLGSAENKSSETIRGELTKKNVTDALGYTPAKESDVPGIQAIFNAVRPVGSTYVQYPQQDDPNALFNGNGVTSTWSVVNYDGAFFRAQGGNAATFVDKSGVLTKQAESVPNVIGFIGDLDRWRMGNGLVNSDIMSQIGAAGKTNPFYTTNIVQYKDGKSGDAGTSNATVMNLSRYNEAYGRRDEVAPTNYTIRVWKRTA